MSKLILSKLSGLLVLKRMSDLFDQGREAHREDLEKRGAKVRQQEQGLIHDLLTGRVRVDEAAHSAKS
jgi:hypothetical protein